jgi:hypothetical protein
MAESAGQEKRVMNEKDAAVYLDMSVSWLRQSRMDGNREHRTAAPPFVRLGRAVKYLREDLDLWLNENRVDLTAS